jgi:LacI family transcriptional regulator
MPKPVTIKDVARAAKVSAKTVSRVVSGRGYASSETRRRVNAVIQRLGYAPNRIASSMVTGRTMALGMVVPDVSYSFFSEIVLGAERIATDAGYTLILCNTAENLEREKKTLQFLHEARVDGVLMAGARLPDSDLLVTLARHSAIVSINHPVPSDLGGNVRSDHAKGIAMSIEHLLKSNRRHIAFMAGPEYVYAAQERLRAFIQVMKNANLSVNPGFIVPYIASFESGFRNLYDMTESVNGSSLRQVRANLGLRGARALLLEHPEVDGIVCYDDQLAFGALRACAGLGRRVPEDVAIIGCNDVPLASQVKPTLTTQSIPCYQMGIAAANMLIERITAECEQQEIIFPHELIVRESAP